MGGGTFWGLGSILTKAKVIITFHLGNSYSQVVGSLTLEAFTLLVAWNHMYSGV